MATKTDTKKAGNGKKVAPAPKKRGPKAKATEYEPKPGEQQYLGGGTEATMAPKAIRPLIDLGRRHMATKEAHAQATEMLGKQAAEGFVLFEKYKEHFSEEKNGTGSTFRYKSGNVELLIEVPNGTPKFKTKAVSSVKDDDDE